MFRSDARRAVLAFDFSPKTLERLRSEEVGSIHEFLERMESFTVEEANLWKVYESTSDTAVLTEWCRKGLSRRGGSYDLEIIFTDKLHKDWEKFLSGQKWLLGMLRLQDDLFDVYAYVINGLITQLKAQRMMDRIWHLCTITLGPVPWHAFRSDEPMNIATRRVVDEGITVIVAVGNEGQIWKGNSLNPWSIAPWVISVGATTYDGRRLLSSSSRGVASQPDQSPTIVAPGETETVLSGLNHTEQVAIHHIKQSPPGTINIAPLGGKSWLMRKDNDGNVWLRLDSMDKSSPQYPLEAVLKSVLEKERAKVGPMKGTSFAAEYISALCKKVVRRLESQLQSFPLRQRPKLLKIVLTDMAEPLPGYEPWEVGDGVVTIEIADRYLSALTSSRFARIVEMCAFD